MSLGWTAGEVGSTAGEVGLTASEPRFTSWCTSAACTGTRPRWLRVGMLHAGHWVPQLRAHQRLLCVRSASILVQARCLDNRLPAPPCALQVAAARVAARPAPPLPPAALLGWLRKPPSHHRQRPPSWVQQRAPRPNSDSKFVPVRRAASPPQLSFHQLKQSTRAPAMQLLHRRPSETEQFCSQIWF